MTRKAKPSQGRQPFIAVAVLVIVVIIGAGVAFVLLQQESQELNGVAYDPPEVAADFTLIDQNGETFRLSDQRGKVVMIFFGFTHCPEACPLTLGIWNRVSHLLGDDADKVQFVFITVDPERDTPAEIAEHLTFFSADIAGLTGTLEEIEDVAEDYSVFFEKVDADTEDNYWVNHTTLTFVVDKSGYLIQAYPYATRAEEIVADLEYLIQ